MRRKDRPPRPPLPPFKNIDDGMLFHEVGHYLIGWLHAIKDQVIVIPREPVGEDAAGASWDPNGINDAQFIRRTVAGLHAQQIYASGSFKSALSGLALAQGMIPDGRSDEYRNLDPVALADLSYGRSDLAQLIARFSAQFDGDKQKIAALVKPHEEYVRTKLNEAAVRKCAIEMVALIRLEIKYAEDHQIAVAMFGDAQCRDLLIASLTREPGY